MEEIVVKKILLSFFCILLLPYIFYKGPVDGQNDKFDLGYIEENKYVNELMKIEINLNSNWEILDEDNLLAFSRVDECDIAIGYNKEQKDELKYNNVDVVCPVGFNDKDTFSKVMIIVKKIDNNDDAYRMLKREVSKIEEDCEKKFKISKKKNIDIAGLDFENCKATSIYHELKAQLDYYSIINNGFLYIIKTYYTNDIGHNSVVDFLNNITYLD